MYKTYVYLYNFFINYPTPANLTNVWNFGIMAFAMLLFQIVTGIVLSFYYVPEEIFAFTYVERIMRDVSLGYISRYLHANGASVFFFVVYIHFFRGLYYFSYISPKKIIWNTGVVILVLMIATAFTGYVLPRGQMSFWACTVITSLATVVPVIGKDISHIVWGSYGVSTITLNRFYTLHFFLPFVMLFLMVLHFYYLHDVGSSNGTKIHTTNDKMKFHPYYTWKDAVVFASMVTLYFIIVLITPNYLNHADNAIPANFMVTPMHIVPEWYFLPFYAILRSAPNKLAGISIMTASIVILFIFPSFVKNFYHPNWWKKAKLEQGFYINSNPEFWTFVENMTSPWSQVYLFWFFIADFLALAYIGSLPVEYPYTAYGTFFTYMYFLFFFSSYLIHRINWYVIHTKGVIIPMYFTLFLWVFVPFLTLFKKINKVINHYLPTFHEFMVNFIEDLIDLMKETPFLNKIYKFSVWIIKVVSAGCVQIIDWQNEYYDNYDNYYLWIFKGRPLSKTVFYYEKTGTLDWMYGFKFPSFDRKKDRKRITALKNAEQITIDVYILTERAKELKSILEEATKELNSSKLIIEKKISEYTEVVESMKKEEGEAEKNKENK